MGGERGKKKTRERKKKGGGNPNCVNNGIFQYCKRKCEYSRKKKQKKNHSD